MKLLLDYIAVVAFFVTYLISHDILLATAVLIPTTCLQVVGIRYYTGKWEKMHIITMLLVVILGGTTLIVQDSMFIKWKPTVVNWLFAVILLGSHYIGAKHIIKRLLDKKISLPDDVWLNLSYMWIGFFSLMGIVNLYVAYNFSEEVWVYFKLFGLLGLTLVFVIMQTIYLAKYLPKPDKE
jgi:intracellular septation protein